MQTFPEIKEIAYASALYEASKKLRDEVLRRPLGLKLSEKDTEGEDTQTHIAAMQDGVVVGAVQLKFLSPERVKLRQMVVSPSLQKAGLGRKLVLFAEALVQGRGAKAMEMAARVYARGFYEKLGYKAVGEEFLEVTIPHIRMEKYF